MQISSDDVLDTINRALEGMLKIVEELGDARVNLRPDLAGANSPYVILAHCVGLTHYWIGGVLAGRQVNRDRDAEFRAQGTVAEIRQAVRDLQQQLRQDITRVQGDQPIAFALAPRHQHMRDRRQGALLMHAYEELAQHHGQMEITRDLLMQAS
jgi:uncharacterized damage-inducible protein DinB